MRSRGPMLVIKPHLDAAVDLDGAQAIAVTSAAAIRALGWLDQDHGLPIYAVGSASPRRPKTWDFNAAHVGAGDVADLAKAVTAALDPVAGGDCPSPGCDRGRGFGRDVDGGWVHGARAGALRCPAHHRTSRIGASGFGGGNFGRRLVFLGANSANICECRKRGRLDRILQHVGCDLFEQAVADAADALPWRTVRVAPDPNQDSLLTVLANS